MSKEAVFTMKLEPQLRAEFIAEAQAAHRPASQVVRELMRDFIEARRKERQYDAFLQDKVDLARASMRSGLGVPNDEVESDFVAKRIHATSRA